MSRRIVTSAVCLALSLTLLTSAGLGRADGRSAPQRVEPSPTPTWHTARLSGATWVQAIALGASPGPSRTVAAGWSKGYDRLVVAVKRPGHPWEAEQIGRGLVLADSSPWIAVDGAGGVTAAWSRGRGVFARSRTPSGVWEPKVQLNPDPEPSTWYTTRPVTVAANRGGAAMVIWDWCRWGWEDRSRGGAKWAPCWSYAAYRTAAGRWRRAERLDLGGTKPQSLVTIDRAGNAMLYAPAAHQGITVRRYTASGGWGPARLLVEGHHRFHAAGTPDGSQVFAFSRGSGAIKVRTKRPGSGWTGPVRVGDTTGPWSGPEIDARGRATIAYADTHTDSALSVVQTDQDGTWSRPLPLTPYGEGARRIAVGTDSRGNRVVAWQNVVRRGTDPVVWASYRAVGTRWSTPGIVTHPTTHEVRAVLVALRSDGTPVVGWRGNQGDEERDWRRYRLAMGGLPD